MFKLINQTNLNLIVIGDNFSSHLVTPGGFILVKKIDQSNEDLIRRKLIRVEEVIQAETEKKDAGLKAETGSIKLTETGSEGSGELDSKTIAYKESEGSGVKKAKKKKK